MSDDGRIELRIDPGSEGFIRLVAVPLITLSLELAGVQEEGRKYKLRLKGTQKNLAAGTTCRVQLRAKAHGEERVYEASNVPMQLQGHGCTVDVEVDMFEAGLFGEGAAELSVLPDFPFAEAHKVPQPLKFNNPLDVRGLPDQPKVLLGRRLRLTPVLSRKFERVKLRLSVLEAGSPNRSHLTFEWTPEDKDSKTWRVGCAESEGQPVLTWLETRADMYTYDLRLEVIDSSGGKPVSYPVWERAGALYFPKPRLKSFDLHLGVAEAKVENIDPDFKLPLELSLWSHEPLAPGSEVQVMDPLTRPAQAESSSWEFFLDLLRPEVVAGEKHVFALLRIPKALSGTDSYVPVSAVMDYDDSKFLAFDDDQLWLEPPKNKQSKALKTPKDLATAVASAELKVRPTRTPRFGAVSAGVRDNNLLLSFRLVGDTDYWKAAAPTFSLYDEAGQSELVKLKAKPSETNPRVYEALLPLTDKSVLGKKVSIQGQLTHPDARLWNEPVAAPSFSPVLYEGTPWLGDLEMRVLKLADDTSCLLMRCRARHIPNGGQEATVLAFRVHELMGGLDSPIELTLVKFRYELPKGGGGLCNSQGWLVARILDKASVERLAGEGRFRLEACVPGNQGMVLSQSVASTSLEFGGSPRNAKGLLVFGALVPETFRKKVIAICEDLDMDPDHLMACMAHETGETFKANIRGRTNKNAVGLIQFTPSTEKALGKTVNELAAMTELEQLDYVQKYFRLVIGYKGPLKALGEVYAAMLWPEAVGQPETYRYFSQGTRAYEQNKGLDRGNKGYVTKADTTARVEAMFEKGKQLRM